MECYEIGSVVRSARIRHGMTQEDLAFGICAVSTLSKIVAVYYYHDYSIPAEEFQRMVRGSTVDYIIYTTRELDE